MTDLPGEDDTQIIVSAAGRVGAAERDYAVAKISKLLRASDQSAEIRLDRPNDTSPAQLAKARATIDLGRQRIRAHVAAPTMTEAIDKLEERLRQRLETVNEHRIALRRRGGSGEPGEWRHGDRPSERPPYHQRPVEEREVVEQKSFAVAATTVDEAVLDLEAMDYDFYLFGDLDSGDDAVVFRDENGEYGVRLLRGAAAAERTPTVAALDVEAGAAPVLDTAGAEAWLNNCGDPWVFYRDAADDRGRVLYRRYDGHYGLITPTS